jgi:hypothetical protein
MEALGCKRLELTNMGLKPWHHATKPLKANKSIHLPVSLAYGLQDNYSL